MKCPECGEEMERHNRGSFARWWECPVHGQPPPEIDHPDPGGVEEFKKRKPAIEQFSKNIDKGLKVSRKSLDREIDI